ncbi:transcription factor grauzone-like [Stomoxys calcitrans]|uniref:transcription factor grauzone-like n=1 Tax=Stomoxys calcitrans TaxID=35570 RepID=UPI0027E2457A|nr:transcription factor grauzone-like [Stomoxys calcitrans]XP_059224188.1 transcription factor grauzone-like [Stomoxys calcitrans]XP_059224189.1 transcription factor grauzone-like [Stomoxys calcitrans]
MFKRRNGEKLLDTSFGKRTSKEIDEFIAQWKQDLDCYLCSGTAPSMFALRQHFRKEHHNKRCYVLCCQRKLSRRHQLEEHIRVHVDPGAFKCQLCGKCCTNKRTLSNHMYEHHTQQGPERSFECPICQKRFAKKPVWKRHMEIHEPNKDHVCKECGKGFPTEQRRIVHQHMVHNVERVCDQCGKIFCGIYTLRQHLLEHAGVERRKWPCDQCTAQLNTHTSLKRHKQVAHNDRSTVYICSECGKVASSSITLLSHKKYVHKAPRKFKCTICEKAFKTNLALPENMASHTGEDLYTCPHCPKTFKVSSNMHHHRKKAHPIEWAEARLKKPMTASIDMKQETGNCYVKYMYEYIQSKKIKIKFNTRDLLLSRPDLPINSSSKVQIRKILNK